MHSLIEYRSVMAVKPVCRILQHTEEALPAVDGAARNRL